MTRSHVFTSRDLDILNILLNSSEPMTCIDIIYAKRGKENLTQSTVTSVIRKLLKEGYVEVAGITHAGKVLARTFVAADVARTAIVEYLAEMYRPFVPVLGISPLINSIVSLFDEDMKKKLLAEIKNL